MLLRYFYDQKLAQASYMVGCPATREALIIDPCRSVELYLEAAQAEDMKIIGVTETHIHADFVSGARELAAQTGALLYLSDEGDANWKYGFADGYPHRLLKDGESWRTGNVEIEVMHTPGHTPEHLSFIVTDTLEADKPMGIFTGDFVFVGDVGRPDLLETAAGIVESKEPAARELFRSLQRFKQLPDYLQIWPGHGAGSACGKSLGAVPSSTVGYERMFNWAFRIDSEAEFVREVLEGQPEPPRYFAMMKQVNKAGPILLAGRLPQPPRLPATRLAELVAAGAMVVDTRPYADAAAGFVPGSINIPLDRSFNTYAGWLLSYDQPYYLLVDDDRLAEAVTDLIRIGLDNVAGYFTLDAIRQWPQHAGRPLATIPRAAVTETAADVASGRIPAILDVRSASEFEEGHLPGALHVPLGYVPDRLADIPADRPLLVYCQTGHRSSIAASLLVSHGRTNAMNMVGGYEAWTKAGLPVEKE